LQSAFRLDYFPVAKEKAHLDLGLDLLEVATEDDLPLTRLETINDGRNRSDVVSHREEDEFLVDEVGVGDQVDRLVKECSRLNIRSQAKGVSFTGFTMGKD
jgi:hypothetical protein